MDRLRFKYKCPTGGGGNQDILVLKLNGRSNVVAFENS